MTAKDKVKDDVKFEQQRLLKVLLSPHMTEKSTMVADKNRQYVFKVISDATKIEIKRAVELLFDVAVKAVNVCNIKGKQKRFAQRLGRRDDIRKAYVTLKDGYDINFMGTE